jgi:hypothetical protein
MTARALPEAASSLTTMIVVFRNDETLIYGEAMPVELERSMIEIGKGPLALPTIAATATCMHQEIGTTGTLMVRNTCRMNSTEVDRVRQHRRCMDTTIDLHPATRVCHHPVTTTTVLTIRRMISIGTDPRIRMPRTISTLWTTGQAIGTGIGIAALVARIVTAFKVQVTIEAVARSVTVHVVAATKKVFEV